MMMRRVMIVGGSGSGKSTLARTLGAQTGLPVFHMDHIHWQENWQARPRQERLVMAMEIEAQDHWIFEGGFSTTYENRATRADTLIWLDLPVGLRLWRVTKRLFRYWGQSRPDMAPGCTEGFHSETLPFYRWIWDTRQTGRQRLIALTQAHQHHTKIVHLQRPRDVRRFLESL